MLKFAWIGQQRGFTLVELLVVMAIIAILAVVGVVTYKGVTGSARDAKRKEDIDAMAKAFEVNSNNGVYQSLQGQHFTDGKIPTLPEGGNYTCISGPSNPSFNCLSNRTDQFILCSPLEANVSRTCISPSDTCYCLSSTQNQVISSGSGDGSGGGSSSCDTFGILNNGLVGYWKMDETQPWSNACHDDARSIIDYSVPHGDGIFYNAKSCPIYNGPVGGASGKFNNAGYFDGVDDNLQVAAAVVDLNNTPQFSVSFWIKINTPADCKPGTWNPTGLLSRGNGTSSGWRIYIANNPTFCMITADISGTGGTSLPFTNHQPIKTDGLWHQVIVTYGGNGAPLSLYQDGGVNGGPDESIVPSITFIQNSIPLFMGWISNANYFKGSLDDVRIYKRVLSAAEISGLYNSGQGCAP